MKQADFIIIGAGSAGCVLANRLTADGKTTVILIEAGGEDRHPYIHLPVGYVKTMVNPAINWMFKSEPEKGTFDRSIDMPRGKVLGGSSSINGMIYVRGQSHDYDSWAQSGNKGWSFQDVLPYFKKTECFEGITKKIADQEYRGGEGPLHVQYVREYYKAMDKVLESARAEGWLTNSDYNGDDQEGFAYAQTTMRDGLRWSAKKGYLNPVRGRRNLYVMRHTMATGLIMEGKTVTGVTVSRSGKTETLTAHAEVILAAGAFQSPQLLELSGIGDHDTLSQHGIETIHQLPAVGKNLQDHYISRLSWKLQDLPSLNSKTRGLGLAGELLKFATKRKGALSMPAGIVLGFVKSRDGLLGPDIQYHIANASYANPAKRIFDTFPGLTIGPCQLRPESRGSVHIRSADPFAPPLIRMNYLDAAEDQRVHLAAVRMARQLMENDVMSPYVIEEARPGKIVDSDDELLDYVRQTGVTLYHPVSTCRMGTDANTNVVDDRLRVHGMKGIRIVDASIMPSLVSGNTNAPTLMIAEKASDMIIADNR